VFWRSAQHPYDKKGGHHSHQLVKRVNPFTAEEIAEAIVLAAEWEHEERKFPTLGNCKKRIRGRRMK
jgi:hypothetical protein